MLAVFCRDGPSSTLRSFQFGNLTPVVACIAALNNEVCASTTVMGLCAVSWGVVALAAQVRQTPFTTCGACW